MSPHQNPYYPEPPYTLEHCQRCLYGRWHDTGFLRDSNGREYYATTRPSHFKPDAYVFGYYGLMLVEVSCATGPLPPGCPVALELWGANPEIIIDVHVPPHQDAVGSIGPRRTSGIRLNLPGAAQLWRTELNRRGLTAQPFGDDEICAAAMSTTHDEVRQLVIYFPGAVQLPPWAGPDQLSRLPADD